MGSGVRGLIGFDASCAAGGLGALLASVAAKKSSELADAAVDLAAVLASGGGKQAIAAFVKQQAVDLAVEKAIDAGLPSDIANLASSKFEDVLASGNPFAGINDLGVEKILRGVGIALQANWPKAKNSLVEMAQQQSMIIVDEYVGAIEELKQQFSDNEKILRSLRSGNSYSSLSLDIENVPSIIRTKREAIERRFASGPPTTAAEREFIIDELEDIRASVCAKLGDEAQKYVVATAKYISMLNTVNRILGLAHESTTAINTIKFNICAAAKTDDYFSKTLRYADTTSAYIDVLKSDLKRLETELRDAINRQDPYVFTRILTSWCQNIATLIALLDGLLVAPTKKDVVDSVKKEALDLLCRNLGDIPDIRIERIDLEYGKVVQSLSLIATGVFTGTQTFQKMIGEFESNLGSMKEVTGFMKPGTFGVDKVTKGVIKMLDDNGLDIAVAALTSLDVSKFLNLNATQASLMSIAQSCIASNANIPPKIKNMVDKYISGFKLAQSFSSMNSDFIRSEAINAIKKQSKEFTDIMSIAEKYS